MNKDFIDIELLEYQINRAHYTKNTFGCLTRMLFLKYVLDNFVGVETTDQMKHFALLQKQFAAREVGGGPNPVHPVLSIVDDHFGLNGMIHNALDYYAKELYGLDDNWSRKTASLEDYQRIMGVLASYDFEEREDAQHKGTLIVDALVEYLQERKLSYSWDAEYRAKADLGELAKGILQVGDEETFLDLAASAGTATMAIVGNKKCRVINCEYTSELNSIAAMLYIMKGYKNFSIRKEDFLFKPGEDLKADKIFAYPPQGIHSAYKVDTALIAIDKALMCSLPNTMGMVVVNSKVLFGAAQYYKEVKGKLVNGRHLKAVVALPINMPGSAVTVNFVVFTKQENKDVLFVNGNSKAFAKYVAKDKSRNISLTKEGVDFIVDMVNNGKVAEDISVKVAFDQIDTKEFNLMPNTYVAEKMHEETLTIEEIDSELSKLYAQLGIR